MNPIRNNETNKEKRRENNRASKSDTAQSTTSVQFKLFARGAADRGTLEIDERLEGLGDQVRVQADHVLPPVGFDHIGCVA